MVYKYFSFILVFLLVGCSQDSDIKLLCDCEKEITHYFQNITTSSSNLNIEANKNRVNSEPTKSFEQKCWSNRIKDVPVVFNDDKNSFKFSNIVEEKITKFNANEINILLFEWDGSRSLLNLNRTTLILTYDSLGIVNPESEYSPGLFHQVRTYQCRNNEENYG
ncbi:hypothetical protein N9K05_03260 [Woeseiaceae bacterium]|nr:hypothetical protein [Woeseiaceae bacterium]